MNKKEIKIILEKVPNAGRKTYDVKAGTVHTGIFEETETSEFYFVPDSCFDYSSEELLKIGVALKELNGGVS